MTTPYPDEKVVVIRIYTDADNADEWHEKALAAIDRLCGCRDHWWQVWRRKHNCSFYAIMSQVEDLEEY